MIKAQFICNCFNLDNAIEARFYDYLFYVPQKIDFIPTIEMKINLQYFLFHKEMEEIIEKYIENKPDDFLVRKISEVIIITDTIIQITIE
jgi:hypothetical protein